MKLATVLLALLFASPAASEDAVFAVLEAHVECAKLVHDDTQRLACFDSMTSRVGEWAGSVPLCEVEAFKFAMRGSHLYMTGATTCAEGKLIYRLYDGEDFLYSGLTHFSGYAFQDYTDVPEAPAQISMKYTIE